MFKAKFTLEELLKATGGEYIGENINDKIFSVSTDTRTISDDDCYLALKGANFDGHEFIKKAVENGAKLIIADRNHENLTVEIKSNFIIVEDTTIAYLKIANFHRMRSGAKIIAVTGSSGKTTTKEFFYGVFNSKCKTHKSFKNHNNEIGLCQTLLAIEPDTKYCIVEMGMRARGEIDLLAKYARPEIAVITNVGTAHIGILGSQDNIAKAKCEITNYLNVNDVLIAHDEELIKKTIDGNYKKVFYNLNEVKIIEKNKNVCKFEYDNFVFEINDGADFMILNALAAIKAAKYENYTNAEIQKGLKQFKNVEFRNELTQLKNGAIVVSDCYNANPDSAKASIKYIAEMYKDKNIVIVFGDMFELGDFSEKYHRETGTLINTLNVNYFISVGKLAKIAAEEINKINKKTFETIDEAAAFLPQIIDENTLVFLKASRGMGFEKILEMIKEK